MSVSNCYKTYKYEIPDKSKDVTIRVQVSDDHPYEANIYSFTNESRDFSEIPPSEANIGKYNPATATRFLTVTVVTPPTGSTCAMTPIIDGIPQDPPMKGEVGTDGIVFHATIELSW